jgi:hypothetical protein
MKQPARLATFLVERLAPPNEALQGDLTESCHLGSSRWWYWRQSVWIIAAGIYGEIRREPSMAVRALFTGIGLKGVLGYLGNRFWFGLVSRPAFAFVESTWGHRELNEPYRWLSAIAAIPWMILFGWILTRLYREQRGMAVFIHAVWVIIWIGPRAARLIAGADRPEVLLNLELFAFETTIALIAPLIGALLDEPVKSSMSNKTVA